MTSQLVFNESANCAGAVFVSVVYLLPARGDQRAVQLLREQGVCCNRFLEVHSAQREGAGAVVDAQQVTLITTS